jgi:hypothetical protein
MTTFIALMVIFKGFSWLTAGRNHAKQAKISTEGKQFGGHGCAH